MNSKEIAGRFEGINDPVEVSRIALDICYALFREAIKLAKERKCMTFSATEAVLLEMNQRYLSGLRKVKSSIGLTTVDIYQQQPKMINSIPIRQLFWLVLYINNNERFIPMQEKITLEANKNLHKYIDITKQKNEKELLDEYHHCNNNLLYSYKSPLPEPEIIKDAHLPDTLLFERRSFNELKLAIKLFGEKLKSIFKRND